MMGSATAWMDRLVKALKEQFGERLLFVGLQGSYARGEASDSSDIDAVVILDRAAMQDLQDYRSLLKRMPFSEKACGFLSGREELVNWDRADLFQFYQDTLPLYGSLQSLIPVPTRQEAARAVLAGACNLYHACCHNIVHERDAALLASLYKSAVFVLQAKQYCETGRYFRKREELYRALTGTDREILAARMQPLEETETAFLTYSEKLLCWSSGLIADFGKNQGIPGQENSPN